ncbi:beta-lactamase superfamily domain-containing protein [Lophiotrema nucula]|uniref:Beta-lactamase superfamily domain-containing protein n=1 Tax=Lophiotrema nucula TaxID=690887 RepID=A0A6A5YQY7_9PLEO|nr:beta-lactamase superfamily domain-containing protein [Lophiotrema nucula]
MPPSTTVTPLPAKRPASYTTPPAHHVGSPPSSFKNPWPSFGQSKALSQIIKARFFPQETFVPVPADRKGLVEVRKPDFGASRNGLKATWIGHASFLVEAPKAEGKERGMRVLLDPVWSERVGPYGMVGPVRFTPPPCEVEDLPEVDAVLISHDHYDHLDSPTLKRLMVKQKDDLRFFCGLGVKSVLVAQGVGIKEDQVTEMDWWDGITLAKEGVGSMELICTPAQHRSGRKPWNFDGTLWCSWIVQDTREKQEEPKRLFFAGDTGYCHVPSNEQLSYHHAPHPPCPAFAEVGELHGPFDLSLLPIGCYLPRQFMSGLHSSPDDAVSIHRRARSKKSIGMHYGTFRGGISMYYEPVTEPPRRFREAAEAEGLSWGEELGLCDIGETVVV